MESNEAAVICQNYDIPFLAIRVLSNTCLNNEEFNPAAGEACQKFVLNVVKEYAASTLAENGAGLSPYLDGESAYKGMRRKY